MAICPNIGAAERNSKCRSCSYQRKLCDQLGKEYSIRTIDMERVIYRDFGNGFNAEISGAHTTNPCKCATVYLWFGASYIERTVYNVPPENIGTVVEELYEYTKAIQ